MTIAQLIDALGGTSAVAGSLSVPVSTVHSWRHKNRIPPWRQPKVLELAIEKQIDFSPALFADRQAA